MFNVYWVQTSPSKERGASFDLPGAMRRPHGLLADAARNLSQVVYMIVRILAFFLLLISAYQCWWATAYSAPLWFGVAMIPLACAIGLAFRRRWASYLWYALAVYTIAWWVFTVIGLVLEGWPVAGLEQTVISLIPGALLMLLCVGGSLAVRREYQRPG